MQGRNDQLVKIRGLLFYPAAIEDAVRSLPNLSDEFRVEIDRIDDMDRVRVTVEPESDAPIDEKSEREAKLSEALKGSLGIRVEVELAPHGTLPRTEFKADRLKDRRPKLPD